MASKMKKSELNLGRAKKSSLTAAALQDHIVRDLGLQNITLDTRIMSNSHHKRNRHTPTHTTSNTQLFSDEQQLTLAQRLGLVAAPPPPLTNVQWDKAANMSSRRGDSTHPCPICQDVFGLQAQVLLSCTHTFHKSCLMAFERYSGKKRCPVCRSPTYQTKLINTGANHYRHTAATRIQALWRGYKVRKAFHEYRKTHPPTHPSLRIKHFTKKLTSLTSKLVDHVAMTTDSAEGLLISVDNDLRESRKVLETLGSEPYNFLNPDWENITTKATQYITSDCVICLTPLSHSSLLPTTSNSTSNSSTDSSNSTSNSSTDSSNICTTNIRPLTVLSCSHLFHTTCITSLESFTDDTSLHYCPTCRLPYTSKDYLL